MLFVISDLEEESSNVNRSRKDNNNAKVLDKRISPRLEEINIWLKDI